MLEFRKQISLFVPLSDWKAIRQEAARQRIPMTELCRRWMKPGLEHLKRRCEEDGSQEEETFGRKTRRGQETRAEQDRVRRGQETRAEQDRVRQGQETRAQQERGGSGQEACAEEDPGKSGWGDHRRAGTPE